MTSSQVKEYFRRAAVTGHVSQVYLIESEDAEPAIDAAKELALLLECEQLNEDRNHESTDAAGIANLRQPCGVCRSCVAIASGNNPDVRKVEGEKQGLLTVDNIRDQLVNDMSIRPYYGRYKIYILPEADGMTVQAQNALLKTLEEMPSYGIVILIAANTGKILPTILSRSFRITITAEGFNRQLTEQEEVFLSLLRAADRVGPAEILEGIKIAQGDKKSGIPQISSARVQAIASAWFRDILVVKAAGGNDLIQFPGEAEAYARLADKYSYRKIDEIIEAVDVLRNRLDSNVNFELAMQLFMLSARILPDNAK